jgi:MFS family permease
MKIKYYYFLLPFLLDMSAGITLFAFPLYAKEYLHLSSLTIGLMAGSLGCLYTGLNLLFEKIEKIIKIKRLIAAGPVLVTLSYISLNFIKSAGLFIFLFSLAAVGHALFWPAFETHLTLGKTERIKKRNLGYFNLGWSTGLTMSGPLLGGFIYGIAGPKAFLISGLIILSGLLLNLVPLKEEELLPDQDPPREHSRNALNTRLLYLVWFSNFLSFLVINTVRTFFPLLGLEMKMSPGFIGFVLFLPGLAQILMTLFLKNNPAWSYNLKAIFWGQGLAILGLVFLGLSKAPAFIGLGLFLPGFMAGITNYSSNLMSLSQEEQGKKRIGIHEALVGLAGIVSGFWGGGISEALGLRAPYLSCALLIGGAIVIQLIAAKRLFRNI